MNKTWLIQRLQKPRDNSGKLGALASAFSFGGGLKNGGLSDEAMKMLLPIFSFDYMGSAEFEFGAVPKSLSSIFEHRKDYEYFEMKIAMGSVETNSRRKWGRPEEIAKYPAKPKGTKPVYVFCRKADRSDVEFVIRELAKNKVSLKERAGLHDVLDPVSEYDSETQGWLELNNHFMFFTDKAMADATVKLFTEK